jgi:hypothetical protein
VQEIEKIVQIRNEEVRIEEIERVIEKPVYVEVLKEIEKIVPYIEQSIIEVRVSTTEPAIQTEEKFTEVPTIIEKLRTANNEIPRIYEVEKIVEKLVPVPQLIELPVEVPIIVYINQIIEAIREKPFEIPIIHESIKEVNTIE